MTRVLYKLGSLGASGYLRQLANLSLHLFGNVEIYFSGMKQKTAAALKKGQLKPLTLKAKEGLALLNGTQFMTAYGVWCMVKANRLISWAERIAALSIDAFDALTDVFLPHTHRLRPHAGQRITAERILNILRDSDIGKQKKTQVQDPYSFRCIPQVHGATRDTYEFVKKVIETEINSVTDNPILFPEEDLILNGGNFHGQPVALALDYLAIAMAEIGSISERRIFLLLSGQRGLPPFLTKEAGLNSGLMIAQYTAASIVSQNRQLCTPASVDSITSSNGQEDQVSMGANAATKLYKVVNNVETILAIELLCAVQALDFRKPLKTSPVLEKMIIEYRKMISFRKQDREVYLDIEKSKRFIEK
jgi:histidine ammonia-lyase